MNPDKRRAARHACHTGSRQGNIDGKVQESRQQLRSGHNWFPITTIAAVPPDTSDRRLPQREPDGRLVS
jgi:hypothetical protein